MNQISTSIETVTHFISTKAPGLLVLLLYFVMGWLVVQVNLTQKEISKIYNEISDLHATDKVMEVKIQGLQEDVSELKQDMKEVKEDIFSNEI